MRARNMLRICAASLACISAGGANSVQRIRVSEELSLILQRLSIGHNIVPHGPRLRVPGQQTSLNYL